MGFVIPIDEAMRLRLLEPHDAEAVFAVINANREHIARWMPWTPMTKSPDDVRNYAKRTLASFVDGGDIATLIVLDGAIVGGVGVHHVRREDHGTFHMAMGDIGYWLAAEAQGRGVMTRAVAAFVDELFTHRGMMRLTILAEPANERSWKVAERLGFRREGNMRSICEYDGRDVDHYMYAILKSEWQPPTNRLRGSETKEAPRT